MGTQVHRCQCGSCLGAGCGRSGARVPRAGGWVHGPVHPNPSTRTEAPAHCTRAPKHRRHRHPSTHVPTYQTHPSHLSSWCSVIRSTPHISPDQRRRIAGPTCEASRIDARVAPGFTLRSHATAAADRSRAVKAAADRNRWQGCPIGPVERAEARSYWTRRSRRRRRLGTRKQPENTMTATMGSRAPRTRSSTSIASSSPGLTAN